MTCRRTRLTIQKPTDVMDSVNGRTRTWSDLVSTFAEVKLVRGREDMSGSQGERQARVETWLATIPFRSDLVGITNHRVVWDGVNYNIRSAIDRERTRRKITLEIEMGVAA